MTKYETLMAKGKSLYGHLFDTSDLNQQFKQAYDNGDTFRVQVDMGYAGDEPKWGYVACTTGWKPSFMLMRTRNQRGSSELIGSRAIILDSHWIK
jgi:hypothetical protein